MNLKETYKIWYLENELTKIEKKYNEYNIKYIEDKVEQLFKEIVEWSRINHLNVKK